MMEGRLKQFLELVKAGSRPNPAAWGAPLRAALSEGFIKVGWGGRIELTDAGKHALTNGERS